MQLIGRRFTVARPAPTAIIAKLVDPRICVERSYGATAC